jgi:hypothetical protein
MRRPSKHPKVGIEGSWEDEVSDVEQMRRWHESAFQAALEKLREGHGNAETVMQTGEAFGRGLFSQKMQEKNHQWTVGEWLEKAEETVLSPLRTEFTLTRMSPDAATLFIERNPLTSQAKESMVASLFMYGVMRGLFQSAFPEGELLCKGAFIGDSSELILKTHASQSDCSERERVKRLFTVVKKNHNP